MASCCMDVQKLYSYTDREICGKLMYGCAAIINDIENCGKMLYGCAAIIHDREICGKMLYGWSASIHDRKICGKMLYGCVNYTDREFCGKFDMLYGCAAILNMAERSVARCCLDT